MKDIVAERRNKWITTIKKKKKEAGNRAGTGRVKEDHSRQSLQERIMSDIVEKVS